MTSKTVVRQAVLSGPYWIRLARVMQAITLAVLLSVIWMLLASNESTAGVDRLPVTGIFWNILVPLVPFILLVGPGLWRNICPLALVNIFGHRLRVFFAGSANQKFHSGKSHLRGWLARYGLFAGLSLLFILVPARLVLFNTQAQWLGGLLLLLAAAALFAGLALPYKSGWCSAICPIYPLEKSYGTSPFILAENLLCKTGNSEDLGCGGCTRNCFDLKLLAKQKKGSVLPAGKPSAAESVFMAILPGFISAYLLLDRLPAKTVLSEQLLTRIFIIYLTFALLSLASALVYTTAKAISIKKVGAEIKIMKLNRIFVLSAFDIYYLMAVPAFVGTIAGLAAIPAVWASILAAFLYGGIFAVSVIWYRRQSKAMASKATFGWQKAPSRPPRLTLH